MRRLLALALSLAALTSTAVSAAPSPPAVPAQGINVKPDPSSTRKSAAGTLAELGTVQPGRPLRDAVLVRSSFDEPREVLLYAADALPAAGGGFGFRTQAEPQQQLGQWLRLEQTRLTVPANGQVRVSYTLTVAAGTAGGEYVGAVVAEPVDQAASSGVQATTRFAMAVYLRVPGGASGSTPGRGRPDGQIVVESVTPGFAGDRACPVIRYRNDSQDVIDPVVTVSTEGLLGGSSYRQERVGALLPDTRAEVALPCVDRPLGPGRLVVDLHSARGGDVQRAPYTWLPWPLLLSLLLLLLLVGALLTTLVRGQRTGNSAQGGTAAAERVDG